MKINGQFLQFKQFQYRVLSTLTFKYEKIVNYEIFKKFSQWKDFVGLPREQDQISLNKSSISVSKVDFEVFFIEGFISIFTHLPYIIGLVISILLYIPDVL